MDVFIYNADLYCEDCILEVCIENGALSPAAREMGWDKAREQWEEANAVESESDYDSGEFPKGPYGDGGGESDSPQHCGGCGEFLENGLTSEGSERVMDAIVEHLSTGRGQCAKEWADFYDISLSDLFERAAELSPAEKGGIHG